MPTIPAFSLVGPTVDPSEIYDNMLYNPSATTLEELNGGLEDTTNYNGGDNSIRAFSVQSGSFVAGRWQGTDRWSFTHEDQLAGEDTNDGYVRHDYLAARLVLPWTARVVWFGYQGWFVHEAYRHDLNGGPGTTKTEHWSAKLFTQGSEKSVLAARFPATFSTRNQPDACTNVPKDKTAGLGTGDPHFFTHDDDRWKYVCRMGMDQNVSRGNYNISVRVWGKLYERSGRARAEDHPNWNSQLTMRSGAIWVLALR